MFFKQFFLDSLGHASYLVGSEETGEALVLDPQRQVDAYFSETRSQGMRITYGIDTHGHNDYLSGLAELSARQSLTVLGSAAADLGYDHRPVQDGQVFEMGEVGIEVLHTPGHTPEHISLLIYDRAVSADHPVMLLSGGALLVGDVARPDLLGSHEHAQASARDLCRTLHEKILTLPDHVEVFPTHVAGSLCGGNIGSRLSTTIGYERRTNPVLVEMDTDRFVADCLDLDDLPTVPPYWARMRSQNMDGVPLLGVLGEPPALGPDAVERARADGVFVLDTRSPEAFGAAHIPGALNVGLGTSFATWAGSVLPADAHVVLVLDDPRDLWDATWQLLRIGYPLPAGWLAGGMATWRTAAKPLVGIPQITVHDLADLVDKREVAVVDVRQPAEWSEGHIPGATFITGAELPERIDDLPDAPVLATVCGSGYRSSVAASVAAATGRDVVNVLGGMTAWLAAGYPTAS